MTAFRPISEAAHSWSYVDQPNSRRKMRDDDDGDDHDHHDHDHDDDDVHDSLQYREYFHIYQVNWDRL